MNLGSYDDSDVDHILILLINDEGMARKVSKWLDPNYLVDYMHATPWQFVIWVSLRQLLEGATEFPSKEYLQRMVFNTALRMYGDESVAKDAADAVQAIHGITPMFEIANERLTYLYKTCVESPNVQAAVADMNMNQDISDLLERVQQLRNDGLVALAGDESRQQLGAFDILDIMDDEGSMELAEQAAESARIPTGIPYIDTLHGGKGIYKGYVTMILGPSAGGKTITGCELASQLAAQGRSVGIFGTEENAVKSIEMRARLYAAGTQVSVADWMKAGCHPKMLPDVKPGTPEYDIVIKCLQAMRRQLSLYDIGDNVSWQSIVGNIEGYAARHQGKMHDVVIIDWAGPLAEAMVVEKEASSMHEALERVTMWSFQQIASRYDCAVVLFHQLSTDAQKKKGVFGNYTMNDSQNCTKMAQHCGAVHVISPHNREDRARYIAAKMRFDKGNKENVVKLDYQHTRLHMQDHVAAIGNRFQDSKRTNDGSKKMLHKNNGRNDGGNRVRSET